jgi:hypothetical protein
MNVDNQLLIGVVLIGTGLLLALLAYMVLIDRGAEREAKEDASRGDETEAISDALEPSESKAETQPDDQQEDEESPSPEIIPDVEEIAPKSTESIEEEDEPESVDVSPEPSPAPRLRINIATLARDELTGELLVIVGDREYLSVGELKDSKDWTRIEYAASDLASWFSSLPSSKPVGAREIEGTPSRPQSMIEQINEILQQKISESSSDIKAVRLIEGTGGSVRVLIGVQSYGLDEIPDPEAGRLIREAVADWEARQ